MNPYTQKDNLEETDISNEHYLILLNDDYNTVDFVVETLMEVCKHDFEQAYQCALITHHKGKCDVEKGSMAYLRPLKNHILDRGLGATIE